MKLDWLWYEGFVIDLIMKYVHEPDVPVDVLVYDMVSFCFKESMLVTYEVKDVPDSFNMS